ncbi:MAG: class I tRNA ligase family protein, partial [bacterium]|nr:class I tRNA ligase family protein [bacterium]
NSEEAKWEITDAVGGKRVTRYKLRDWVFSRQRYWGEPIPIIHCPTDGAVPVPYEHLPVLLPEVDSYEPTGTGESPLAAIESWVNTECPVCGGAAKRETNTMPQWAGSSWYYLRFMDPHNNEQFVSMKKEKYWAPVDVYVGGDHAVRHLIYARFWHKFLYDISVVSTLEPFARLEFLGFILAEDGRKMSKRLGNVINPDDVIADYGADAFRIYEMFMGPFENTTAWSTASIAGTARFIERLWQTRDRVTHESVHALDRLLHETIRKIGNDIETFKFNTAVSQMMIFLNAIEKEGAIGREQWRAYVRLLAPFAPHATEELWECSGESSSIHLAPWPVFDDTLLMQDTTEVTIQVNGKKRGSLTLAVGTNEEDAIMAARAIPSVASAIAGKELKRVIYVPRKILNFVV